jgi:hypothetical protein
MVADRAVLFGLLVAVRVMVALLEPGELLAISQLALLLTDHEVFDVMLKVAALPAEAAILNVVAETVKVAVAAAWVTIIV